MLYYTITTPFFQIFGVLIPCHPCITLHFFSDILLICDMVIYIHCHITVGVSHDILQYLDIHPLLCHIYAGGMTQVMGGDSGKQVCFAMLFLCLCYFFLIILINNIVDHVINCARHQRSSRLCKKYEIGIPVYFFCTTPPCNP